MELRFSFTARWMCVCRLGFSAGSAHGEGRRVRICLLFTAPAGFRPGLSGHIKVISWALLALEVLFFGWGEVRSITGSMRLKVSALK